MSNYPDGMTVRDWAYLDGGEHHEVCNLNEDTRSKWYEVARSECLCGGYVTDAQFCSCDCSCPTTEDIELEKLGL